MVELAVRVRLRIKSRLGGRALESVALVNSGFETEKPQLLVPMGLAAKLGLWPPPPDSEIVELGTAAGPVRNHLVRDALEVSVVTRDRLVGPVPCDAIISHIETEVLINDKLGEELRIMVIGLGSGRWRFIDDKPDVVRFAESPQYW